jgi:phenylalanyl-tRNA synthetase beta chain
VALFEVSGTYEGDGADQQRRVAAGVRRGTAKLDGSGRNWAGNSAASRSACSTPRPMRIAVTRSLRCAGRPAADRAGGPAWYHPGRSGTIKLGPKVVLGTFGEFHPRTLEGLDVSGPLAASRFMSMPCRSRSAKPTKTKPKLELSQFQAVKRDFAFVVDKAVEAGTLVRAASAPTRS